MTHFRFRYKCMSYRRWRGLAARRRSLLLAATGFAPSTAAWRRRLPKPVVLTALPAALRVGNYLVGEEGDLMVYGHPNIRY